MQVVAPGIALPLPVVDLTALAGETRTAERERLAEAAARSAFDLETGPLLLTCLLRLRGPGDGEEEHVLLATLHHIVTDGWSQGLLFEELMALYGAFAAGRPSPLPELPLQYPDFAAWQRGWLRGEALEAQLAYWRRQLAGAPAPLELPTDRPRPARQGFRGGRAALSLPESLADAAAALSRREGASLFMALMAAFQALLCRYTGQEDVPVGTPVAGRVRVELEPLIGLFVNTLVLRGDLSGDPSFRELLGRGREVALEAFAHQDAPFEKLVEELRPERNLAHTPLFQVMLILQNAPTGAVALGGLELSRLPLESGSAKLDLMLSLAEGGGLTGQLEYRTDLFDRATMVRLLGHFEVLLRAAVAEPERRLSSLPLLTEPERRQSLEWNDTRTVYPGGETCLHRLIEAQVDRSPDAVALVFEGERLTYLQLDRRANQLARLLRNMGVGPEVRVGVSLERSLEMVVALLGVLKAGGAYVPLDRDYPPERLRFMREDAGIAVLLSREDGVWAAAASQPGERLRDWESPDQAAYVIYTSGSTGRPKGVVNSHRGVVNRLLWMQEADWLARRDRVLQKTPFSFDVSVLGVLLAPDSWAPAWSWPARAATRTAPIWPALIAEQGITTLHFVPSMLQVFLEEPGLEACAPCAGWCAAARRCPRSWRGGSSPAWAALRGWERAAQPLRADRGGRWTSPSSLPRAQEPGGHGAHRPADRQPADPSPRPSAAGRCRRGSRRAAHRRRGRRPRLPEPPGADGREVRPRSFVEMEAGASREPPLPHGRPRAPPAGRRDRVPGPHRPPGQAARLPHRAGRDRGRPAPPPRGARGGDPGPPRRPRRPAPGRLSSCPAMSSGQLGGRAARAPRGEAAGVHGSRRLRAARRAAAAAQRQGGPQGAARSRRLRPRAEHARRPA